NQTDGAAATVRYAPRKLLGVAPRRTCLFPAVTVAYNVPRAAPFPWHRVRGPPRLPVPARPGCDSAAGPLPGPTSLPWREMGMKILATGATGQLGSLVMAALLKAMPAERLAASVRDPHKAASLKARGVDVRAGDFDRPETLPQAFAGVDRILIISTMG